MVLATARHNSTVKRVWVVGRTWGNSIFIA